MSSPIPSFFWACKCLVYKDLRFAPRREKPKYIHAKHLGMKKTSPTPTRFWLDRSGTAEPTHNYCIGGVPFCLYGYPAFAAEPRLTTYR